MDINGIVFICVIFAISVALLGFCCLKSCSSEDKYERNTGSSDTPILPTSTPDSTVRKKKTFSFQAIPPYRPKSARLDMGSNQIVVENNPKSGHNLPSPPKTGFLVDEAQSASDASIILPYPPPIGFEYPPDVINTDTTGPHCPYATAGKIELRIPSPNLEIPKASYSPRTSAYFSENAEPLSGISFSSENLNNSSKPLPPSYAEAMREHQLPAEYKPYR